MGTSGGESFDLMSLFRGLNLETKRLIRYSLRIFIIEVSLCR